MQQESTPVITGWASWLARIAMAVLLFEVVTGLAVTFSPFHVFVEWGILAHTLLGVITLIPIAWYYVLHFKDYKGYALSHVAVLGYVGLVGLFLCVISGLVVTAQGLFATQMSNTWRQVHLITTFVTLIPTLPHVLLVLFRLGPGEERRKAFAYWGWAKVLTLVCLLAVGGMYMTYPGREYVNEFPEDYSMLYGEDRPFAPSLATTTTGGAFDSRSLAGSESCGTSGCHEEILAEWKPSAHRYAAMDVLFQGVQGVMAEQNGPESTRYCAGCHDPISLFSGSKNIYTDKLTNAQGYQEGVSCLGCHSIQETDIKGNANYVIAQPSEYLWQWAETPGKLAMRDFLIRTYPDEHNKLSRRMFKTSEFCAACHKQFIDEEINNVGWVQLQNQYDNWASSRWNHEGDPTKTVECRECHMPLLASSDPASGDAVDYNRSQGDEKHRSHRFLASNRLMPKMLELEGWEEQLELTEQWLKGTYKVEEIADKWAEGPVVRMALDVPENLPVGQDLPIRVIMTSNKVGHDYPTGPLDIIQSWVELRVTDEDGNEVFSTGFRDERNFIEPGSFMFKAEPVDQAGNLIDRHNLWEMVGVRFRRAIFPGYSDSVTFTVPCAATLGPPSEDDAGENRDFDVALPNKPGQYKIVASLLYRKVDQYMLNFLLGEDSGITAPVTEIDRAEVTVTVGAVQAAVPGTSGGGADSVATLGTKSVRALDR